MDFTNIFGSIAALIVIFLFAIQKFSKQIQIVAGEKLKGTMERMTRTPLRGIFSGAVITALLQSSTATSVILVGLVNAGLISAYNGIGVIVGANIGTTITTQLIALNMTYVAPIIVLAGFIISHTDSRFKKYGKAVFYFGMMFFTLFIISILLKPLEQDPEIANIIRGIASPLSAVLIGAIVSAVIQSSGLTTGLVVILSSQGLLSLPVAIGIMLGANIGTTLTALVASMAATREAKEVAIAHLLFNVIGVVILFPLIYPFSIFIARLGESAMQQVVNAHFLFNVVSALVCYIFYSQFEKLVRKTTTLVFK